MVNQEHLKRVREIISDMTVEEKVSQLTNDAKRIPRLGIYEYNWWSEALHGVARAGTATVFPQAIGLAATWNVELMKTIASVISEEARAKYNEFQREGDRGYCKGLTFWSPNVNIYRDPRWGRGQETYGEDPYLTSRLAVAFIENMQGNSEHMKAAACAKHFAAHSGPEQGRHSFNAVASEKDMRETYLPAFEACVKEAHVEAVMGAYNAVNGVPACCNSRLLKDILRDEWGFEGHVVSDCGAIEDISENHKYAPDKVHAAAYGIKNGCDLNCGTMYELLTDAYEQDLVDDNDLDLALEHLYLTRMKLGMFDESTEFDDIPMSVVACEEHKKLSLEAAHQSLVMLKNDGVLPLKKSGVKKVAVIGPDCDNEEMLLGNYFGTPTEFSTPFRGLREYLDGAAEVECFKGCDFFERDEKLLAQAVKAAEEADTVILCLGLTSDYEGEECDAFNPFQAGDRTFIEFSPAQSELAEAVYEKNKNIILLSFGGGAFAYKENADRARAIIHCWYPGEQGGRAIADVLFGEVSPSGKLPLTFYKGTEDLPDFLDYSMKNRTYKYFEGEAAYTFGYGLSYTEFEYGTLSVEADDDKARISVAVKNTGGFDAFETVKIFRKEKIQLANQPLKSLIRFGKEFIPQGESRIFTFTIPKEESFRINDEGKKEYISPAEFDYFFEK